MSEIEISVKYIVYATMDGCKSSSEINMIIWHFKIEDWLELFLGLNSVTFKEKIFFNNI